MKSKRRGIARRERRVGGLVEGGAQAREEREKEGQSWVAGESSVYMRLQMTFDEELNEFYSYA